MKSLFLLTCVSAFVQLGNNLKNVIASGLEPLGERKMIALSPKMQKNRIYENLHVPREIYPFEIFRIVATGDLCAADENGSFDENINLQVKEYGKFAYKEIMKFFPDEKVDLERADDNGHAPVLLAIEFYYQIHFIGVHFHAGIVKFHTFDLSPLEMYNAMCYAGANGHTDIMELLATQNGDFELADNLGRTPVWIAAASGRTEVVKFLAGKNVNLERADAFGRTPVGAAAWHGRTETVKFLIGKNVQLNEKLLKIASRKEIKQMIADKLKK